MEIEHRKLNEIRPYEANPRINDQAVDAVARSLEEFGFRQPLVIDEDGVIVVGHTRFKAAVKLGLEKVPDHVAKDMTPAQRKAYRLADNATGAIASWARYGWRPAREPGPRSSRHRTCRVTPRRRPGHRFRSGPA